MDEGNGYWGRVLGEGNKVEVLSVGCSGEWGKGEDGLE